MSDRYVTLIGAEDVRAAAARISSAAEDISRACAELGQALVDHQRVMSQLVEQYQLANTPTVDEPKGEIGWQTWYGGFCPVEKNCRVDVMQKNGQRTDNVLASQVQWRHFKDANFVVAWRQHEEK